MSPFPNTNQPVQERSFDWPMNQLYYVNLTGTSDLICNNSLQRQEGYYMPLAGQIEKILVYSPNSTPVLLAITNKLDSRGPLLAQGDQLQLKAIYSAGGFTIRPYINGTAVSGFDIALGTLTGLCQILVCIRLSKPWSDAAQSE